MSTGWFCGPIRAFPLVFAFIPGRLAAQAVRLGWTLADIALSEAVEYASRLAAKPTAVPINSPGTVQLRLIGPWKGVNVNPLPTPQAFEFGIVFADLNLPGFALARRRIALLGQADPGPEIYRCQPDKPQYQESQHRSLGRSCRPRKAVPQSRGDRFQRHVRLPRRLGATRRSEPRPLGSWAKAAQHARVVASPDGRDGEVGLGIGCPPATGSGLPYKVRRPQRCHKEAQRAIPLALRSRDL